METNTPKTDEKGQTAVLRSGDWFGPSEWLTQLMRCQNGDTTCMRTLEIIERETVSMGWVQEQHAKMLELCYAIERLPASEQQTALSLQASAIAAEMQRVIQFVYAEADRPNNQS